jgi:hypothetical protein
MNVLFFEITPTGSTSESFPIGANPKIEYVDLYSDFSVEVDQNGYGQIKTFTYDESTKELLVWETLSESVPA